MDVILAAELLAGLAGTPTAAANYNPHHDARGRFARAEDVGGGGGGTTKSENQQRGEAALELALETRADVERAMSQAWMGEIDFRWGSEGEGPPDYRGGSGLAKVVGKHGIAAARKIPEIIEKGLLEPPQGNVSRITFGRWRVLLTRTEGRDPRHWVLTGYEKKEAR